MTIEISVLVTSLLLSAFFSGMEIAFVSSNKIRLEIKKTQKILENFKTSKSSSDKTATALNKILN